MKAIIPRLPGLFILIGFALVSRANAADTNQSILHSRSVADLRDVSKRSDLQRRRDRACEIQRQKKLVPSFCYSQALEEEDSAAQVLELDSECRRLSLTATELPLVDALTSQACREAIEMRAQDLAYAEKRNASR